MRTFKFLLVLFLAAGVGICAAGAQTFKTGNVSVTVLSQPQVTFLGGGGYVMFDISYVGNTFTNIALGEYYGLACSPNYDYSGNASTGQFGIYSQNPVPGTAAGGSASGNATTGIFFDWSPSNAAGTYTISGNWIYQSTGLGGTTQF
ncbi:MAG TPA: hypothetical protein VGL42_11175 [Opitutaceae bacterium]|jgi:hypothetical protein